MLCIVDLFKCLSLSHPSSSVKIHSLTVRLIFLFIYNNESYEACIYLICCLTRIFLYFLLSYPQLLVLFPRYRLQVSAYMISPHIECELEGSLVHNKFDKLKN